MKKIICRSICCVLLLLVCTGCVSTHTAPSNHIEQRSIIVTIKVGNTSTPFFVQTYYKVYENIKDWKKTNPIIELTSIVFEEDLPLASSFHMSAGKTYIIEIWNVCECSNCDPCYIPQNMLNQHFFTTVSSDETFTIQPTGYFTKSDGLMLNETVPP